jgi:hypothetical protein
MSLGRDVADEGRVMEEVGGSIWDLAGLSAVILHFVLQHGSGALALVAFRLRLLFGMWCVAVLVWRVWDCCAGSIGYGNNKADGVRDCLVGRE